MQKKIEYCNGHINVYVDGKRIASVDNLKEADEELIEYMQERNVCI